MPLESILYLSFVVSALVLFASVLTYAERATRQLNNDSSTPEQNRKAAQRQPEEEETVPLRRAA